MGTSTILVLRCDRCGHEQITGRDLTLDRAGWATAGAQVTGGRPRIGGDENVGVDLCPGCATALFSWWSEPAGPTTQPTPAAPPPPPVLTIEDRKLAVAAVVEAIRLRTDYVLAVVREQPTEILSGAIVPGTLVGIEDTAAGMVDAVLARLRITVPGRRS